MIDSAREQANEEARILAKCMGHGWDYVVWYDRAWNYRVSKWPAEIRPERTRGDGPGTWIVTGYICHINGACQVSASAEDASTALHLAVYKVTKRAREMVEQTEGILR